MAKKMYTIGYVFHPIYGGGINYPYVRTAFMDTDTPLTERDVWNEFKKVLQKELSDKLYNIDFIRLSLRNLYKRRSF